MTKSADFDALLGTRIAALRKARGLSQADLANLMDPPVGRVTMTTIEAGKQRLLAQQALRIAEVLNIEVGALLGARAPGANTLTSAEQARLVAAEGEARRLRAVLGKVRKLAESAEDDP